LILAAVAVVVSALIGGVLIFGHKDPAREGTPSSGSNAPYVSTAPEPEVQPTEQIRRKPDPPPIPSEPRDQPPIPLPQKVEPSIRATREAQETKAKEQLEVQEAKAKEQLEAQIRDGISRAQSEYSQGHYATALGFLKTVLRIDPGNKEAIQTRDDVMKECAPIAACEAK
jgi:type IV secretory pathway VirB10-like protein